MKRFSLVVTLLFSTTLLAGDIILLDIGDGQWREITSVGQIPNNSISRVARLSFDGPGKDDPDKDETLQEMVATLAKAVNEPGVADAISKNFAQFAASLTDESKFDQAVEGIKQFNEFVIRGSTKANQWRSVFVKVDEKMIVSPKTAATLLEISRGFAAAKEGRSEEFSFPKLITCLPCIIDAFLTPSVTEANLQPIPVNP